MRCLYYLLLASTASYARASSANETDAPVCKCVPGDSCWPSSADFTALNDTLSGNLVQGVPPGSVCYSNEPNYNQTECQYVLQNWFSSSFHAANPISIGWPWWANNSCPPIYPNGTSATGDPNAGKKGCSIGSYPVYSVNATTEDHVVAAVNFAREKNIRLNTKSTGHSFQGRSTAFGSLSVWTHNMRGIEYHESFQPQSCPLNKTQMGFTIAAGERDRNVYEAANAQHAVVVAGSDPDVGVVGHFSSGGHGPLSSSYGLAVDNVLEIRIVTRNGELCTANPCLNPDLFWALRGGGGGTFGVVTSVTMKAYSAPQATSHSFTLASLDANNQTAFWDTVAFVLSEFPRLKEGGMQGYSTILPPGIIPQAPGWVWSWGFYLYDKPNGTAEALFAPIAAKLDPLNGTAIFYNTSVVSYPDFFSLWNSTSDPGSVATSGATLGSRLLPAEAFADQERVFAVLQQITAPMSGKSVPGQILQPFIVANKMTGRDGKVTPAGADAVLHFVLSEGFLDNDTFAQAQPTFQDVTNDRVAPLSLAPDSGYYQNEADPFDPNLQYDFFGPNYARLKEIKDAYDLDSLMWCVSCVGSEDWAPDSKGRLCRLPWSGLMAQ